MSPLPSHERLALAALTWLGEPGDPLLWSLASARGPAQTLELIRSGRLHLPGLAATPAARTTLEGWRSRLGEVPDPAELAALCTGSTRLVCPGDDGWPERLHNLGTAQPLALWVRGRTDLSAACKRSVAIVGSRAATAYGTYIASEIAASVAAQGWTVISGAAYGVDAAAHHGALGADGVTVAVLACGVDRPYPADHAELLDAIAAQGTVVSEWPPGSLVKRTRFLLRNRVIAALAAGTLIVEAAQRSGTLDTARHAAGLGRPLMAVPGPVTSVQSAGCHTAIRDWQATLITSAGNVIDTIVSKNPALAR